MPTPLDILKKYWQFDAFREMQEDIINAVLNNQDTIALLPTGGGKTMCFQIPALIKPGICIVVSPLIALIQDQVQSLKEKGIKAIALTGGITFNELDILLDNAIYGDFKFLYLSPERLQQELVLERIKQMNVSLIAIDEAHCISQWGHDFRPAYRNCSVLKELFPKIPTIALTASATLPVIEDININLQLKNVSVFKKSFQRSNIAYMTYSEENFQDMVVRILKKNTGSSIVYVRNRKATKDVAAFLTSQGFSTGYYHGGLTSQEKKTGLNNWLSNHNQVMVATNAFGMGIDKPDVRTVIHISYPDSIESYFQEAGRAGRDGKKAFAILLRNKVEERNAINQYVEVLPDIKTIKKLSNKLYNYFQISYGEETEEVFPFNFVDFCNTYQFNHTLAYQCLKILDRFSVISLSENFQEKHVIHITASKNGFESYLSNNIRFAKTIDSIVRTYGGVFNYETNLDLYSVAAKSGVSRAFVEQMLQEMAKDHILNYKAVKTDAEITFLLPREDDSTINSIAKEILVQHGSIKQRLQDVIDYINNDDICKNVQLLAYFGEKDAENCGICSVCISKKYELTSEIFELIKRDIKEILSKQSSSSGTICSVLPYEEKMVLDVLNILYSQRIVLLNYKNEFYLA